MLKSNHVFVNRTTPWSVVLLGVMALFFVTCGMQADVWNKKTVMTFNEPVQVGREVLPAGTYVFKLVDSPSNRHIVQVLNEEENHVFTTILTIPEYRDKPTSKTVVELDERPSGQPQALRAWFYPGDTMGEEFVSREPRTLMAKTNTTTTTAAVTTSPITETTPAPSAESSPAETPAPQPSDVEPAPYAEESVEPEQQAQPQTPETTPAPAEPSGETLPTTASYLPLAALAGLSSLCAAAALRLIRKGKS